MNFKRSTSRSGKLGSSFFARKMANALQRHYEAHRVPETWGSPSVSHYVFDALRHHGFLASARELIKRMRTVGLPRLSTAEKITALIAGIGLVTLADCLLPQEKQAPITHRSVRQFVPHANTFAVTLYVLGAALLVAANEGSRRRRGRAELSWL